MKSRYTIANLLILNGYRTLIGLVRGKIIALRFSVVDLGILGQLLSFINFQSQFLLFGSGAALNTLVFKQEVAVRYGIFRYSLRIILISNLIFLIVGYLIADRISNWLLKTDAGIEYIIILLMLGPLYSIYRFLEISVQAQKRFDVLIRNQYTIYTAAFLSVIPLTYYYGIFGILASFGIWYCIGLLLFIAPYFKARPKAVVALDKTLKKNIMKICIADFSRNVSVFLALIIFRIIIVQLLSLSEAGFFHSVWSITNYANIIIQGFIVFLFPTLGSISMKADFNASVNAYLKTLLLIVMPILILLLYYPDLALWIFYSRDYTHLGMEMRILLVGKLFEIVYLYYLIVLLAANKINVYFGLEIVKSVLLIIVPYYMVEAFQLQGAIIGLVVTNVICFLLLWLAIRKSNLMLSGYSIWMLSRFTLLFIFTVMITYMWDNWIINGIMLLFAFTVVLDIKTYVNILKEIKADYFNR
jgi:antigen flippase